MEIGKLEAYVIFIVLLVGGTGYYGWLQLKNLRIQVDGFQTQTLAAAATAAKGATMAQQSKFAADNATDALTKINAEIAKATDLANQAKAEADALQAAQAAKPATKK